jgi:hypothetical protein
VTAMCPETGQYQTFFAFSGYGARDTQYVDCVCLAVVL